MGLLDGKKILVCGVLTPDSIAFHAAKIALEEGAQVVLTSFGRAMRLTTRTAGRLPVEVPVVELDVADDDHLASLAERLREHVDGLDGVVHSIAFAPEAALGGNFLHTSWDDVATAVRVSTYSLPAIAMACRPLFGDRASVVGLTFDATIAWPKYDWMGVAKAGLESASRYLARDLGAEGVRVNLVSAGPLRTMAAKSIPGFDEFKAVWETRAPLGWDLDDPAPAARACVALLSDWFPATTGEIVHVDGGVHAIGA
jgi:enoyl-[acyl-carrier protein] reductase I